MINTRKAVLLIVVLGLLPGCRLASGEKYIAPSANSMDLVSHPGVFWIVPGHALLDGGRTMGPQQNLLYLLIVCPKLSASARGTATDYGESLNVYLSNWETTQGKVSISVAWDKRADMVTIGKDRFKRREGSVFVVVRQSHGELVSSQLPNPHRDLDANDALRFIQERMKDHEIVSEVRLAQGID
jgi:hypothetical protein